MARKHIATTRVRASSPHVAKHESPGSGKSQLDPSLAALAQVLLAATGCSSAQDLIDRIADAVVKKLEARLSESERRIMEQTAQLKRHVTRRVGQLRKPGDTKPGPTMSAERKDDMRRVDAYVKEGYSVNKACDMVDAENRERGTSFAHYASAAAMRDAYPRWHVAK